jgi:TolB-like protein/tetratricopeptide (TPR) repeat protein
VSAAIWISQRNSPDHPIRVTVQPFETLSNTADVRSLARRIPNEVVDALGDSQIEAVLSGEQAGKDSSGLIIRGIVRDDARNTSVDVRIEDSATHNALWSTEFKRDDRQTSDLPLEVAARVADMVNMVGFARGANPPLTDNSALSAVLQISDMIRDSHGDDWAQMLQHAQGLVARHPDFAFGHSLLAAAYSEAAENIGVPDRAKAMAGAARREANLTLKLDPKDAGAYAVLSELEPRYDYSVQERILLRGTKYAKHPKEPLGALYQYEGALLNNVGRLREGLPYELVAQATDQWSPSKTAKLALVYANMGNLAAARSWLQKATQRWPNHPRVREIGRYIAAFSEPRPDALAIFNRLETSSDEDSNAVWQGFIAAKAARSGRTNITASRSIREAADNGKIAPETEIMMLAALGETKQAVDAANSALDHQSLQPWFLFTPVTRNLRQDPGFIGLASRMGLIKYWHETGKLPDFCTDPASRDECSPQLLAAVKS